MQEKDRELKILVSAVQFRLLASLALTDSTPALLSLLAQVAIASMKAILDDKS